MVADLAKIMRAARLQDVRESGTGAVGTLALRPRGVARVIAAVEGEALCVQAQLLPVDPHDAGWRAAEAFLAAAVGQIEGVEARSGCARAEGVAGLQVAGRVGEAPRLTAVMAAVAAPALGRAHALLAEPRLAAAYLDMRRGETGNDAHEEGGAR